VRDILCLPVEAPNPMDECGGGLDYTGDERS
jgi:hypothetical protein